MINTKKGNEMRIAKNNIEKIVNKLEELKTAGYTHSEHFCTSNHGTQCYSYEKIEKLIEMAKNGYLERPTRGLWMNSENEKYVEENIKAFGNFMDLYSMISK